MNIGIVGLGKLGLPVALAIEAKGHTVYGWDVSSEVRARLGRVPYPFKEAGVDALMCETRIELMPPQRMVDRCDIIFVAVQTPHAKEFDGTRRLPQERKDFDYTYLRSALTELASALDQSHASVIATMSTCLPGTYRRELVRIVGTRNYVYTPLFVAMGTVIRDFYNPEFVLVGVDGKSALDHRVLSFFGSIHNKPILQTDITTAELIKVGYNTAVMQKINLVNSFAALAQDLGANIDDFTRALSMATDRIISPKYLRAGMGDGGACHPRDNIALSWLAQRHNIPNIWEAAMLTREALTERQADFALKVSKERDLPLVILGRAFKPESDLEDGSCALLLANILREKGWAGLHHDETVPSGPSVFFIATAHSWLIRTYPEGSVVIDPWGIIPDHEGVQVIRLGRE